MKFLPSSLSSKHPMPPAEPSLPAISLTVALEIGEFGELSWYQPLPPEEHYDGGSFVCALNERHSAGAPVARGSKLPPGALSVSTGTQDYPIDLTSLDPSTSTMPDSSIARRSDRSLLSSESTYSTLNLSAYSSSFPVVPPTSDRMIEALSLGLERDYHEALVLGGSSSSSSSASSSRSDLFDSRTSPASYPESGRTTPDTEWEYPDGDSVHLPDSMSMSPAVASDSEGCTVRLVSSRPVILDPLLPALRKWGSTSS